MPPSPSLPANATLLQLALDELATSASLVVARGSETTVLERTPDVTDEARFLVFSLSKTVTAVAVMQLVESGELATETRIASVLPEFGRRGKAEVTVDDVLTHRGGFPDGPPDEPARTHLSLSDFDDWEHAIATMCALPSVPELRGIASYHALSYSILGAVVEKVSGLDFRTFCERTIFARLGMARTTWGLPDGLVGVALAGPTAAEWPLDTMQRSLIPAANAWSTADDLARFMRMLGEGGSLDGQRVLEPATVALMTRQHAHAHRQVGARAFGYGLFIGTEPGCDSGRGSTASDRCFGHAGFTAVQAWFEPRAELTFVVLTNSCVDQAASDRRFSILADEVRRRHGSGPA